jgi:hypothetical protein
MLKTLSKWRSRTELIFCLSAELSAQATDLAQAHTKNIVSLHIDKNQPVFLYRSALPSSPAPHLILTLPVPARLQLTSSAQAPPAIFPEAHSTAWDISSHL